MRHFPIFTAATLTLAGCAHEPTFPSGRAQEAYEACLAGAAAYPANIKFSTRANGDTSVLAVRQHGSATVNDYIGFIDSDSHFNAFSPQPEAIDYRLRDAAAASARCKDQALTLS